MRLEVRVEVNAGWTRAHGVMAGQWVKIDGIDGEQIARAMTDNRRAPPGSVAPSCLGLENRGRAPQAPARLAGMDRHDAVAPAPAEVVEFVRPGRAVAQGDSL